MDLAAVLQTVAIVLLVAASAMLVSVGAYGSGVVLGSASAVWFWRLYRTFSD
ncbi:hypothetical protein R4172_07570 [Rhodococcus kroppenstedtii]|uniref:Uncharacterized protein n=1 Tax=Rhodococcoides kroppenstedtii TaxID=293050 RepID=A0ABS7NRS0_9NOCA|nr:MULTISPECIES: hypothetical protein [Rhodococcus]MBT1192376.1 hypothetical protein [Rhodococcus kroppenstedtii]MBY6312628.1 hypothetical protein [Rhodococcus kroppenstedtii]MBY6320704.1 hypothetical protein [Rhodococcus kroppenstedtii]MBY6399385.1 hypothetical protein [Rhodococcus kroppenstedtii]MDV7197417.1 hypothetical protein [Rhodococcus kroppenstedtii]